MTTTTRARLGVSTAMFASAAAMSFMARGPAVAYDAPNDRGAKSVEEMAEDLKKSFGKKQEQVQEIAEKALAEAEKSGKLVEATKDAADKALSEFNVIKETLKDIEQKMARRPGPDDGEVKSYGSQVVTTEKFKSWQGAGHTGAARFSLKALSTGVAFSQRETALVSNPRQRLVIRDLLNVVKTTSGSIDYMRQSARVNNAAVVAEGAQKPTSNYNWTLTSVAVRTIAHLAKLTRQQIDDVEQLQGEVDAEMRYGLALAEEGEQLNGDGTGQHLTGLIPAATAFAAPIVVAGATRIDNLRLALLQAELALYPTDGIVLSPGDWAGIELTKDGNGRYVWADPMQLGGPRLWGQPVVSTPSMALDKFLVGAFKLQTLYDRMEPEVVIASENNDDFEKNSFTMRCESRQALAIKKPGGLIYGDFGLVG
jgi:HK97 family phage major capsid protein